MYHVVLQIITKGFLDMYFSLGGLIWETNSQNNQKNYTRDIFSQEGNCTKGHNVHPMYVDSIPNTVSQGVFVQECPSEHQQGGQPSDGTESERKKEREKE